MKVLFVCKHNRFRSKVAEALFTKYAGPLHQAKSAGMQLDISFPYVAPFVKQILRTYGVFSVVDRPTLISEELISWADRIVIVADNVDLSSFPHEKVSVWSIPDCSQDDLDSIRFRVRDINDNVLLLLKSLATKHH